MINNKMENKMKGRILGESVSETFEDESSVYVIGWTSENKQNYILEELQDGSYWMNGEEGELISDSNHEYESLESFENYLNREYLSYALFSTEDERSEYLYEKELS